MIVKLRVCLLGKSRHHNSTASLPLMTHFGPQRSDFAVVQNTALQGPPNQLARYNPANGTCAAH